LVKTQREREDLRLENRGKAAEQAVELGRAIPVEGRQKSFVLKAEELHEDRAD
jgi:hypothetical protein